ncbi:lipopolysaccharide transport system ATP-binding protein [Salegentibacter echinorum]|uniref:Lipopolysaccharide transport system ATP-binding protein n=1 Tax=Salegentibacter echinorum TaxID=1073325 RepID=A0A1M5JUU4_SALEC|nr:ABC transporter ATP-binding protein [Salegentibacter echinorum]SHG44288.1 lipopolysaccharide transport system ATP-binding protein [Salegentibacter echinorum]
MGVILKAENISKQYRLGRVGTGTLSHDLNRWWHTVRGKEDPYLKVGGVNDRSAKATEDYVWALRDINFEVNQGEVLGIIGKNGAGKSTLLKILSRVTAPTTGRIRTKGRIASLLEVGTGFHPELTGRENIFMNGAVLGMTKTEIKSKLDEIIAFSGCEKYIDTPTKRYSSGMKVRLGFAVAAHLEPEILVVDEVLAVGDAEFQKKAIGKMQDLSGGEGRTVLFVSHNMASVKKLCTTGIVLENGTMSFKGIIDETLSYYQNTYSENVHTIYHGNNIIKKANLNNETNVIKYNSTLQVEISIEVNDIIKKLILGIVIKDLNDVEMVGVNNRHYHKKSINDYDVKKGKIVLTIDKLKLLPGKYKIDLYLGDTTTDLEIVKDALKFEVVENFEIDLMKNIDFRINKIVHEKITWDYSELI